MSWNDRLKQEIARGDIPEFLGDLQALVAALREDRPWADRVTPILRDHPELVLEYLQPGAKRDAVAQSLR